jgi:hypothetical protein
MSETYKNPEVDPAKDLHEEFADVSPYSSDMTRGRIGRLFPGDPTFDRPFKVPVKEYLDTMIEKDGELRKKPKIFGEDTITKLDQRQLTGMEEIDPNRGYDELTQDREDLLEKLNWEDDSVVDYVNIIASRIVEEAKSIGLNSNAEFSLVEQARDLMGNMHMRDFESFLRFHVSAEKERFKKFKERFKDYETIFANKLVKAKLAGKLPESFDIERAKSRLGQSELLALDIFNFYGSPGVHYPHSHTIALTNTEDIEDALRDNFFSEEEAEFILGHEAVHLTSGIGVVQEADREAEYLSFPVPNYPIMVKNGLRFAFGRSATYSKRQYPYNFRFNWLNEAVTETDNIKISEIKESKTREQEIQIYKLLREKGAIELPEYLFEEAYYEDFDPTAPAGQRLPKWNLLRRSINEAYDRQFIIEIDDFIAANRREGLTRAIEFLEALTPGQYGKDDKTLQELRMEKAEIFGIPPSSANWVNIVTLEHELKAGNIRI